MSALFSPISHIHLNDMLPEPLTQIVGGVGLLLAGVLNLVGKLLSGLGLDSLLKGIYSAMVRMIISVHYLTRSNCS